MLCDTKCGGGVVDPVAMTAGHLGEFSAAGSNPEAERLLLHRIAEGGAARQAAIAELYRRYAGRFRGYFRNHRLSDETAEDLVQELFIKVVRACGDFRGDARADTWLWAIARNTLMSHLRSRLPEMNMDDDQLQALADTLPALQTSAPQPADDVDGCVSAGIGEFSRVFPERGQVMVLLVQNEWSAEQIAGFLGRTPGATREYLSQCRKKLKPYIEHCLELLQD